MATDRMPASTLPFGFRKQSYFVDSLGKLGLIESRIYLESNVSGEKNDNFEENTGKHKGLKYLNEKPQNDYEQKELDDYVQTIENEYNAIFVFGEERDELEKQVRKFLKEEIKRRTEVWIDGSEGFGRFRK